MTDEMDPEVLAERLEKRIEVLELLECEIASDSIDSLLELMRDRLLEYKKAIAKRLLDQKGDEPLNEEEVQLLKESLE
jgi:hypothetical protein